MVAKQQASLTLIHYNLGKLPESVQTSSSFFFFLVSLFGLQDLSSLTRDLTWALEMEVQSPKHWTSKEFPQLAIS